MIVTHRDSVNLALIEGSGQCFRWRPLSDGSYLIPFKGKALIIKEVNELALELDCSIRDFREIWSSYLDLETDYGLFGRLIEPNDIFLKQALDYGKGMRILRQDPWETLITFILSQRKSIPAIKRNIRDMCGALGSKNSHMGIPFNDFPTPRAIAEATEGELDALRLGYRKRYVRGAAEAVSSGRLDLKGLGEADDSELYAALTSLNGVGPKIAQCVMLFGYGRLDAFPVDVWIDKALRNEYPNGFNHRRYEPYNGVIQQYIFHYYRSVNKKASG